MPRAGTPEADKRAHRRSSQPAKMENQEDWQGLQWHRSILQIHYLKQSTLVATAAVTDTWMSRQEFRRPAWKRSINLKMVSKRASEYSWSVATALVAKETALANKRLIQVQGEMIWIQKAPSTVWRQPINYFWMNSRIVQMMLTCWTTTSTPTTAAATTTSAPTTAAAKPRKKSLFQLSSSATSLATATSAWWCGDVFERTSILLQLRPEEIVQFAVVV